MDTLSPMVLGSGTTADATLECDRSQLFSRHETVLSSHLDLLDSVKTHMASNGDAFRTVSSMVQKTVQAMNQLKLVRKKMVSYVRLINMEVATDACLYRATVRFATKDRHLCISPGLTRYFYRQDNPRRRLNCRVADQLHERCASLSHPHAHALFDRYREHGAEETIAE